MLLGGRRKNKRPSQRFDFETSNEYFHIPAVPLKLQLKTTTQGPTTLNAFTQQSRRGSTHYKVFFLSAQKLQHKPNTDNFHQPLPLFKMYKVCVLFVNAFKTSIILPHWLVFVNIFLKKMRNILKKCIFLKFIYLQIGLKVVL